MNRARMVVWLVTMVGTMVAATGMMAGAQEVGKEENPPKLDRDVQAVLDALAQKAAKEKIPAGLESQGAAPSKGVVGKIWEVHPCGVAVSTEPVTICVGTEMGVSLSENRPYLFVRCIAVKKAQSNEYFVKCADSARLTRGSHIYFGAPRHVHGLPPGKYLLVAQVRTVDADGNEIIRDTKVCPFEKTWRGKSAAAKEDPLPEGWDRREEGLESAVATRYLHYLGEQRIWLFAGGDWRFYDTTNDPNTRQIVQDVFAASGGFTVTVWYNGDEARHVYITRNATTATVVE